MTLRVLMTGGGTAGHINPALTIAAKIKAEQPDAQFLFVGAEGRMETRLVPAAGYELKTMRVEGFQRKLTPKNIIADIGAAWHAVTAGGVAKKIIQDFQPDIAIGTGGYVCGPVLRKAAQMGVPVVVHESNALPGVTVKMLAKYATICLCDESARQYLPAGADAVVTGNPLPADFSALPAAQARDELKLDSRPLVVSLGGSLGAAAINKAMTGVLERSHREGCMQHIHATGKNGYDDMTAALTGRGVPLHGDGMDIREYIHDMPRCMAAADVVVCRCGAMTLAELAACGKPAILIPSPYVAENHQFHNAMTLVDRGAALCIEEKDLTADRLWDALCETALRPERLAEMSRAALTGAVPDAADRVYRVIMSKLR